MDNFPARLKEALKHRNFKASDLAKRTKIERGTISNYLSGKYKPKAKNVLLIAEALKVNVPWLMGNEDVPMEIDPAIEYHVSEEDVYARAYLKLEYSELVEMNITKEEWCALYDEFELLSENSKTDIMKYIYLNFAMAKMVKYKDENNIVV